MGWFNRAKMEEYIISTLNNKYSQFTTTIEYDLLHDDFIIYVWKGNRFEGNLFLRLRIGNWEFYYQEEIVDEVVKAIEKKINPQTVSKKKIALRKCECCGAILNSLTCEYCGAQYMEV